MEEHEGGEGDVPHNCLPGAGDADRMDTIVTGGNVVVSATLAFVGS